MNKQVEDVVCNGIPGVYVDNDALIRENTQRKEGFDQKVKFLRNGDPGSTNWKEITDLYDRMRSELL